MVNPHVTKECKDCVDENKDDPTERWCYSCLRSKLQHVRTEDYYKKKDKKKKILIIIKCRLPIVLIEKAIAEALSKFESIEYLTIEEIEKDK